MYGIYITIKLYKKKKQRRTEHMKVMERIGREARRSNMAAAAVDGLPGRRERMSYKRRRGEEEDARMDEEDCKEKVEDKLVLSQMSSSARRRNHMVRVSKKSPPLKVAHEMIGVQVPRKARSASGKRSHENSCSASVKEQKVQKRNVETRKKMKPIGAKNRPPNSSKSSSGPVEEEIEIEIAKVLFGLMKQSQSSKDSDSVKSSNSNLEAKDTNASKEKKEEVENTSMAALENNSVASAGEEVESDQQSKMETKSEGASDLQKEEANPSEFGRYKREDKFEFDLMALPPMEDSASDKFVEEAVLEKLQDKKIEVIKEKINGDPNQDSVTKLQEQPKAIFPKPEKTDWRSGLSATTLQPGNSLLSRPCSKRCATHGFIARNIYLHQKVTKMNNFLPAAAGSAPLCDTKPDMVIGNPIPGSFPGHSGKQSKHRSSEAANFVETSQSKKLTVQQSPSQPASAANLMHGPTFKFPVGQNQASVAAASNPSGPLKHTESTNNASQFNHSALPTVAAVNLNTPNVTFQEAPYLAINGYSFPISTPSGTTLAFQGGNSAHAVPLYNGPFYSNQMFHPSQLHQQQPHSQLQHQVRSIHQQNMGISTDSLSSSHRKLESQQLQKTQYSSMQSQQSQKQYMSQSVQSCKLENDINGGNIASSSHTQHSVYGYGQNFAVPLQPMNFTLMPYVTLSGGGSGNHSVQSQQQDLKGVFGMSFASLGGNKGTGTLLNFSSMAQNPATFQSLPATQGAQQKNHQVSEWKTGGGSENPDHDGIKAAPGKSSSTAVQTLVFDNSATHLNFTTSNSQQQHLFQFHQLQQQPVIVSRSKGPKALLQCNTSVQSPKNSGRSLTSQVPIRTSTVNRFLQQQGRASQGQTQISFGGNPRSSLAVPQGQLTNPSLLTT